MEEKVENNTNEIKKMKKVKKNLGKAFKEAIGNIGRTEVSELKYIFINNKEFYGEIFRCIGIALNNVTDPTLINKIILDINLVSKIKNLKFSDKESEELKEIKSKMEEHIYTFEDKNILKSIIDWLYYGSSYELFVRNENELY